LTASSLASAFTAKLSTIANMQCVIEILPNSTCG
jgi:hypothetical protein